MSDAFWGTFLIAWTLLISNMGPGSLVPGIGTIGVESRGYTDKLARMCNAAHVETNRGFYGPQSRAFSRGGFCIWSTMSRSSCLVLTWSALSSERRFTPSSLILVSNSSLSTVNAGQQDFKLLPEGELTLNST